MQTLVELLYESWVGSPDPSKWPDHLKDVPVKGQAEYAFHSGLRLGLLLAIEALYPEVT